MDITLNQTEYRILGALVEKEMTTPDYYPLSLNSLQNACNQKSNRQPVLTLDEDDIIVALDKLRHQGLAMQSSEGGRVAKFCHALREKLHLDEMELALLAELLLRGAQTPGELRSRADRMVRFDNLEETEAVLNELIERDQPLVIKLPRQPGRKECRYTHLLSDKPEFSEGEIPPHSEQRSSTSTVSLEGEVTALRQELEKLREEFDTFKDQFS